METERYTTPGFTQHHLNISDRGCAIAYVTRRAARRGIFGPGQPLSWDVATVEGTRRFTAWADAKAEIRRAMAAA